MALGLWVEWFSHPFQRSNLVRILGWTLTILDFSKGARNKVKVRIKLSINKGECCGRCLHTGVGSNPNSCFKISQVQTELIYNLNLVLAFCLEICNIYYLIDSWLFSPSSITVSFSFRLTILSLVYLFSHICAVFDFSSVPVNIRPLT